MSGALELVQAKGEPRVDTRVLADQLGLQHESVMRLVNTFTEDFELLGKVRFEIRPSASGQKVRFALLNEDQCYLLLTFSRNTKTVRGLKVKLVTAFREARMGESMNALEYLPGYHALHDRAKVLANGSPNEKFVHSNLNKLVNKAVGIESGTRSTVAPATKARIVVAQEVAARAMESANDHHDGYAMAKQALDQLGRALTVRKA